MEVAKTAVYGGIVAQDDSLTATPSVEIVVSRTDVVGITALSTGLPHFRPWSLRYGYTEEAGEGHKGQKARRNGLKREPHKNLSMETLQATLETKVVT